MCLRKILYTIGFLLLLSCKEKKQEVVQIKKTKSDTSVAYSIQENDTLQQSKGPINIKSVEDKTSPKEEEYSPDGNWQVDCKKGAGRLSIDGNEASLTVLYNQIYIDMKELKKYDFEKGIAYTLKEVPEDIGNIGRGLNWKEYVNNEPIAYLKIIDENTMLFYWYGFYNKTTKQRECKETNFQQESKTKEIILKRCSP